MGKYVLGFREIDQTQVAVVGGKGAQLGSFQPDRRHPRAGWLLRDDGRLPAGHDGAPSIDDQLDRLSA